MTQPNNNTTLAVPVTPCHPLRPQAVAPFLYSGGLTPTLNGTAPNCYGISTRFHHVDADMGSTQCAERVHLNSLLWCVSVPLHGIEFFD